MCVYVCVYNRQSHWINAQCTIGRSLRTLSMPAAVSISRVFVLSLLLFPLWKYFERREEDRSMILYLVHLSVKKNVFFLFEDKKRLDQYSLTMKFSGYWITIVSFERSLKKERSKAAIFLFYPFQEELKKY